MRAALLVVLTVLHSSVYFVVGLPDDVAGWFGLFGDNPLGGLLDFELLMVGYVVLSVPVVLALYVALRRASPSLMAVYIGLSLVGIMAFIVARPAFEMLSLSEGFAAATTDAQRSAYLAAGEATLAVFHGTAFWVSYLLGSIGGLILAAVMLRTTEGAMPATNRKAISPTAVWLSPSSRNTDPAIHVHRIVAMKKIRRCRPSPAVPARHRPFVAVSSGSGRADQLDTSASGRSFGSQPVNHSASARYAAALVANDVADGWSRGHVAKRVWQLNLHRVLITCRRCSARSRRPSADGTHRPARRRRSGPNRCR